MRLKQKRYRHFDRNKDGKITYAGIVEFPIGHNVVNTFNDIYEEIPPVNWEARSALIITIGSILIDAIGVIWH